MCCDVIYGIALAKGVLVDIISSILEC